MRSLQRSLELQKRRSDATAAWAQLKIFGECAKSARSELAFKKGNLLSAMNALSLKIQLAPNMNLHVNLPLKEERTSKKRLNESKQETLIVGSRSKTKNGAAHPVVRQYTGHRKFVITAASLFIEFECQGRL